MREPSDADTVPREVEVLEAPGPGEELDTLVTQAVLREVEALQVVETGGLAECARRRLRCRYCSAQGTRATWPSSELRPLRLERIEHHAIEANSGPFSMCMVKITASKHGSVHLRTLHVEN